MIDKRQRHLIRSVTMNISFGEIILPSRASFTVLKLMKIEIYSNFFLVVLYLDAQKNSNATLLIKKVSCVKKTHIDINIIIYLESWDKIVWIFNDFLRILNGKTVKP